MVPRFPHRFSAYKSMLTGRHALVTGASGFVGANLVRALITSRCGVTAVVRKSSDLWRLRDIQDRIETRCVDLTDATSLSTLSEGDLRDIVFHVAAEGIRPADGSMSVLDSNLLGSVNLLSHVARRGGCQRFVFCSSCSVYGQGSLSKETTPLRGTSVYALTKRAGELICRSFHAEGRVPIVVLRLFTPYGPYESSYRLVAGTLLRALNHVDIPLTYGEQARDFIYIGDVVRSLLAAATAEGIEGEIINICTGVSTTIRAVTELILEVTGSKSRLLYGVLPYRSDEVWEMSGDDQKMRSLLGVHQTLPLSEGLRRSSGWFVNHSALYESPQSK
jgi:nucleoside-diphosphate-sugar epimerase